MDLCLLTSPVAIADRTLVWTRLHGCLQRHGFVEGGSDTAEELAAYRARLAEVERRWAELERAGWTRAVRASRGRPYEWLCASGEVELAGQRHAVQAFLCPAGDDDAALSLLFEGALGRALHAPAVRAALVALVLDAAASAACAAFAVRGIDEPADLAGTIAPGDVRDWLLADAGALLAGLRGDQADAAAVRAERRAIIERDGYLVLDTIGARADR